MSGTGIGGVLIIIVGVSWSILSWRLWRDSGGLKAGTWGYRVIYNRLRRWPWQSKDPELSREEIRNYARGSMLASVVGIAVGLLLLVIYLIE